PVLHRDLLVANAPRGIHRALVADLLGHVNERLVPRLLERLVRVRVRGELARRVRVELGEQGEAHPARLHHRVLDLRRAGAVRLEPLFEQPLLTLGLGQVLLEDLLEPGMAGDAGGDLELRERLLLDRVGVGQILNKLFLGRAARHRDSSTGRVSTPGYPFRRGANFWTILPSCWYATPGQDG